MPSQLFNTYTGTGKYTDSKSKIDGLYTSNNDAYNSIIFDTVRHSIWAQGEEYGYNSVTNFEFSPSYAVAPTYNTASFINNTPGNARRFLTGLKYETTNDKTTISYTYAYESSLGTTNANTGDFLRGISVSGHQITYSYNSFKTTGHAKTSRQDYVLTYAYINSAGEYHYTYRDISTTSGTAANNSGLSGVSQTINNNTKARVLTNIVQQTDGKISYTYQDIYTNISLSGSSSTSDIPVIVNMVQDTSGNITYYYKNLTVSTGTKNTNTVITNSTTLNVITGIKADKSGKISYTYNTLNTTHTNTGTNGGTTAGNHIINNINLDSNGNLTYTYRDISGSQAKSNDNNFLTGYTQTKDGKVTFTSGKFSTDKAASATNHSAYVVGISIDTTGKISYNYANINHTYSGTSDTSNLPPIIKLSISTRGAISYTYRDISGNASSTYFTYSYTQDKTGKITSWQSGTITVPTLSGGTAGKEYVKDVTWSNATHTLEFTKGYLDGTGSGGSGSGGGETSITYTASGTTGNRKFVKNITFGGNKNHAITITYNTYPAVVCKDSSIAYVIASGSTLRFYSTEP